MKRKCFLLHLVILMMGATACRTSRQAEVVAPGGTETALPTGTYWELVAQANEPGRTKSAGAETPGLTFTAGENSVSGYGGCNRFRGTYELKPDYGIRFSEMVITRKMCPDAGDTEDRLMDAFRRTEAWALKGDTLILYGEGAVALARFTAAPSSK